MAFREIQPDLFLWSDVCNVYVFRKGDTAILFDLGDGSVLGALKDIGVSKVEWVLFTHHHREQCQGAPLLKDWNAKIAAPDAEKAFFEQPTSFRKMKPTLGDAHSVYGASYVRPPLQPIHLDRTFKSMDDFTWNGHEFWCVDTRGHSPGGMSYLLKRGQRWIAISGDAMLDGAKLHNWFDSEWDYGFAAGIYALHNSAAMLERFEPEYLLPSHGPIIKEPGPQFQKFQSKLKRLAPLYVRGYDINRFAGADQDFVSKPSPVPHVWQVTPHIYKFKGPNFWPNFFLILADSGKGLIVDCGLFERPFLDKAIGLMQERLGLKQIDALVVTHMHGDHCLEAVHLREKYDAKLWTLERVSDLVQFPERFDYAAQLPSYGNGAAAFAYDRLFKDGETFTWEGFQFTVDWMPGQTEFALCMHGTIDGRRVAFTGDNIFASPTDPTQTGHEAVVARNSCILEEGYLYGANYMHGLQPDLILGGHSWVLDKPKELIERNKKCILELREAFQDLSTDPDYRYSFDPYWVRANPYRVTVMPGASGECFVHVRNFRERPQNHKIMVRTPEGLTAEPAVLEGKVPAESTQKFPLKISAAKDMKDGVFMVSFDTTLDKERYGEWFDVIVQVGQPKDAPAQKTPEAKKGY